MKDEEMAEEYAENLEKELMKEYEEHPEYGQTAYLATIPTPHAKQAFLAGLKAGRPQWHDLRKDKNDLPKGYAENTRFLCSVKGETLFLIRYGSFWQGNFEVDAWCEIPTFDKE